MKGLPRHSVSVVIAAGGEGRRMGSGLRKPWLTVAGEPVVVHTLRRFAELAITREIILVVHPSDVPRANELIRRFASLRVTAGGGSRVESVRAGLELVSTDAALTGPRKESRDTAPIRRRVYDRMAIPPRRGDLSGSATTATTYLSL